LGGDGRPPRAESGLPAAPARARSLPADRDAAGLGGGTAGRTAASCRRRPRRRGTASRTGRRRRHESAAPDLSGRGDAAGRRRCRCRGPGGDRRSRHGGPFRSRRGRPRRRLAIARAELDGAGDIRLAVIALGKTGARELNYVSDVDVVFVLDSAAGEDCRHLATELAQRMRSILSDAGAEPALWEVDTALRPEGKAGALVRTLSEFEHYYADIAQNWEFQALLKARPVAGDAEVGEQFSESLMPLVWQAAGRSGFIDGIRSM